MMKNNEHNEKSMKHNFKKCRFGGKMWISRKDPRTA